jgi:uncharacterized protein YlzI (FlbEa/FlbD family)
MQSIAKEGMMPKFTVLTAITQNGRQFRLAVNPEEISHLAENIDTADYNTMVFMINGASYKVSETVLEIVRWELKEKNVKN